MATDRLRLAIVGCGLAAHTQWVPALRYAERGVVVALCDPDPRALELLSPCYPEAELFGGYAALLASDSVDAVVLLTPTSLHAAQILEAAAAGKHVLCEKPLATTLDECDQVIAACATAGVTLMTGLMKRFDKSFRYVKGQIDKGSYGDLHSLICDWRGIPVISALARTDRETAAFETAVAWRRASGNGGGALADLGAHTFDLATWWLGDAVSVSCEFSVVEDSVVDDSSCALVLHEGGARSVHLLGFSNERWHEGYQLDGSAATLKIDFRGTASHVSSEPFTMTRYSSAGAAMADETQYADWSMDLELARFGRYTKEAEHFCECALEGKQPIVGGLEGRKATEIVTAAYVSAYTGEKIKLPFRGSADIDDICSEMKRRRFGAWAEPDPIPAGDASRDHATSD